MPTRHRHKSDGIGHETLIHESIKRKGHGGIPPFSCCHQMAPNHSKQKANQQRPLLIILLLIKSRKKAKKTSVLGTAQIERAPKTRCIIIISFRFISSTNCPTTALSVVGRRHLAKSMQEVSTTCVLSPGQGPPFISCTMYSPHRQNRYKHRNHNIVSVSA